MNSTIMRPVIAFASLLLAGCAGIRSDSPAGNYRDEQAKVERVLNGIFDAAETKELERLDSYHFYGPKFTKFGVGQLGREDAAVARKREHDGVTAVNELSMKADDLKVDVFGEAAIATFIINYSYRAGNQRTEKKERSTLVFVKDHGNWKIAHEHFSQFNPSP